MTHTAHQTATDRAIRDLTEAAQLALGVALMRDPTTRRPWREPSLTPEQRAELDYAARVELAERAQEAPGEHPDAARADVLDVLADVLNRAVRLAEVVSRAAWCPTQRPPTADGDPRPYLQRAAEYLPVAVQGWPNASVIAWWVADEARALLDVVKGALALLTDGQRLKALCPWCQGRTEWSPVGGAHTWRVRQLPGNLVAIVCEGVGCEPPSADVGTWWRGQPAWPVAEWDWLARRLQHVQPDAPRQPLPASAAGATGRAGTPVDPHHARALLAGSGVTRVDRWPVDNS